MNIAENDTTGVISHRGYIMSHGGYTMSHRGSIRSHLGWIMSQGALQADKYNLGQKVFNFICVLQLKMARDAPGLTRERRDDDYSP